MGSMLTFDHGLFKVSDLIAMFTHKSQLRLHYDAHVFVFSPYIDTAKQSQRFIPNNSIFH